MNELLDLYDVEVGEVFYFDGYRYTVVSFFNSNGVDGMITTHRDEYHINSVGRVTVWRILSKNTAYDPTTYKRVKVSEFTLADILHNHMVNGVAGLEVER